ncbi:homoserine kinase type II [Paenibacillus cellulosilyticus]|uniref:Homoserine kinase type II n=1 Tax=Paenibacillus cellulosilyticus TaxID=375489 RepID=A0A2V2YN71_9BACL|nr:phosphotransferase [Paenibacillus cellulosilyticus]PWV97271.1 homoserine kinase type II [Paenibacillus cellulosilyticus]QKS47522.1 phosphotransferase [Paenibacillus cellulosilyticus]
MSVTTTADAIRDDLFNCITSIFGIHINDYTQIEQGYLNLKWMIDTDIGGLFVKQYNKTRYPDRLMNGLEISLNHQSNLYRQGIPTPELFAHQGKHVLVTPSGERFVLMRQCGGNIIQPGSANETQMYTLGQVVGKMHTLLNANPTDRPLHWDIRCKKEMDELWHTRWLHANTRQCAATIKALEAQRKILDKTDVELFSNCERGWGHWDLFADNLLFQPDAVSAILDFDRLNYVYPEFDISRPILSCALDPRTLPVEKVRAFVSGYREYNALSTPKLIRSIKLTWWKEAEWVTVEQEYDSTPIKRFRVENNWVSDHWDHLEDLFAAI